MADAVRGSGADLGAVIDAGGERLTLIDGTGRVLTDDEAIMAFIELLERPRATMDRVALPVTASDRARVCARARRGADADAALVVRAARGGGIGDVSFASDRRGGYVFPAFLPAFDAAAALVRLVSLLGQGSTSLAEIVDATPPMPIVHDEVATPMEQKGLIMRTLMEQLTEEGAEPVLVDGIKVVSDAGMGPRRPRPRGPGHPRLGGGIGPGARPRRWRRATRSGSPRMLA